MHSSGLASSSSCGGPGGAAPGEAGGHAIEQLLVIDIDELKAASTALRWSTGAKATSSRHGHVAREILVPSRQAWTSSPYCGNQVHSSLVPSVVPRAVRQAELVIGDMVHLLEHAYPLERPHDAQ